MKINQEGPFNPVTIVLETREELIAMRFAFYHSMYSDERIPYEHLKNAKLIYGLICNNVKD